MNATIFSCVIQLWPSWLMNIHNNQIEKELFLETRTECHYLIVYYDHNWMEWHYLIVYYDHSRMSLSGCVSSLTTECHYLVLLNDKEFCFSLISLNSTFLVVPQSEFRGSIRGFNVVQSETRFHFQSANQKISKL